MSISLSQTNRLCASPHSPPRVHTDECAADVDHVDSPTDRSATAAPLICIAAETLEACQSEGGVLDLGFCRHDDGDAYSSIHVTHRADTVPGTVRTQGTADSADVLQIGKPDDRVRIIARWDDQEKSFRAQGYVHADGVWQEARVDLVPVREELYSRTRGLIETDALAGKTVFVAGAGSGGAPIILELAKQGIGLILMDHDRLEVANVVRHPAGLSHVGRYKTKVLAEMVRDKNPYASVATCEDRIDWDTHDRVQDFVRRSDLVICAVDDHDARVILNKICVEENRTLLLAGCFRRAYGGQVLVVKPRRTPCYQCFVQMMPEQIRDQEISSREQAERHAYSDRPVAIEPGLSTDIAPVSLMTTKLAIQILLEGQPTTLRSLDDDLVAPWYLWLNRREPSTDYAQLKPMGFEVDGMHVLRWYGIDIPRAEDCPCCGDFLRVMAEREGITLPAGAPGEAGT